MRLSKEIRFVFPKDIGTLTREILKGEAVPIVDSSNLTNAK